MLGGDEIENLQWRKRALVLESSLHRVALKANWEEVRAATAWARSAGQTFRQVRPWLLLLAPLAGLLAVRNPDHSRGLLTRALSALKWIRPLLGAWERLQSALAEGQTRPPADS
jgi:hypothetical protein